MNPVLPFALPVPLLCVGLSWQWRSTSAGPGRGVEVVLMGAAIVLAFPKQQDPGWVTAGRTHPGHVACQALAVTCCQRQKSQHGGQRGKDQLQDVLTPTITSDWLVPCCTLNITFWWQCSLIVSHFCCSFSRNFKSQDFIMEPKRTVVLTLANPVTVVIVTKGTFGSTKTRGQQSAVGGAGSTREWSCPTAGITWRMAS